MATVVEEPHPTEQNSAPATKTSSDLFLNAKFFEAFLRQQKIASIPAVFYRFHKTEI